MGIRYRKPYSIWPGRLIRGRRLDRNPLRRGSDRLETAIFMLLAAAFAAGAPFAASASGTWEHAAAHREQLAQEGSWRLVPAIVTSTPASAAIAGSPVVSAEATASWTAPDGATISSQIPVPWGTKTGATVRIWIARDGAVAQAPLLDSQVSVRVWSAETGAVTALAITLLLVELLARRSLDRRRMAAWEAEWRTQGPRWTTRT